MSMTAASTLSRAIIIIIIIIIIIVVIIIIIFLRRLSQSRRLKIRQLRLDMALTQIWMCT